MAGSEAIHDRHLLTTDAVSARNTRKRGARSASMWAREAQTHPCGL